MNASTQMKIDLEGVGHALSDNWLRVPPYQRDYAWLDKHVNDLYQDIETARSANEPEYFVGSIVVIGSGTNLEVVDGQQRLATTSILIAAIRDYFYSADDPKRAEDIERKFLLERDIRTQEQRPHLRLNQADHDFYSKRILGLPDDPARKIIPTNDSEKRLARAAELAASRVALIVQTAKDPARLLDWLDYIYEKVRVIWVKVPDESNAFRIFETLNDRGLDLVLADLLKNYLFSRGEDRLAEVQQRWLLMLGAIETEDVIASFIRHFWLSKFELARERELYAHIKKRITSKQAAVDLAGDLARLAPLYQTMLSPDDAFEAKYGTGVRNHMTTLNILGMIQVRPLILSVLDHFNVADTRRALRLMVSWAVRLVVVGGLGGGVLERQYSEAAIDVAKGNLTKASHLKAALQKVIPTDIEFRTAFEKHTEPKAKVARYYLRYSGGRGVRKRGDGTEPRCRPGKPRAHSSPKTGAKLGCHRSGRPQSLRESSRQPSGAGKGLELHLSK